MNNQVDIPSWKDFQKYLWYDQIGVSKVVTEEKQIFVRQVSNTKPIQVLFLQENPN